MIPASTERTLQNVSRYSRQLLLPQIGTAGQEKLRAAKVLLIGCGALGTQIAEQFTRAGIGSLRIADRDTVEFSNLQRQTLFDESHAREGTPKAVAAAARLGEINSEVAVEAHVVDVGSDNIEPLAANVDLIMDGTDNVATRYLVNDVAVKLNKPWVYGACVGVEGRVMPVHPHNGPCLRCVFESPAAPGELPTCDTVGVLGAAAAIVASWQVAAGIRIILADLPPVQLMTIDVWAGRTKTVDLSSARRADCPCCGRRNFEFLNAASAAGVALCGRDAVQIRPDRGRRIELKQLALRLAAVARVELTDYLLRAELSNTGVKLSIFPDGRAIVHGTSDTVRGRAIYDRYVGT